MNTKINSYDLVIARSFLALIFVVCLLTAAIFHTNLSDHVQNLMLLKNIAMAGGFMLLSYVGAGRISIDGRRAIPSLRVLSRDGLFPTGK